MSEIDILKKIREHEERLNEIESVLASRGVKSGNKRVNTTKVRKGLPDYITELRENGFFKTPKTAEQVQVGLENKYHAETNRIGMALLRMSKRKELRRATIVIKDKKYQAYVW